MWKSPQASQEFARRRLRILVSRNTWFLVAVTWLCAVVGLVARHPQAWFGTVVLFTVVCVPTSMLFGWLWLRAHYAWNKAVADAGTVGEP